VPGSASLVQSVIRQQVVEQAPITERDVPPKREPVGLSFIEPDQLRSLRLILFLQGLNPEGIRSS